MFGRLGEGVMVSWSCSVGSVNHPPQPWSDVEGELAAGAGVGAGAGAGREFVASAV